MAFSTSKISSDNAVFNSSIHKLNKFYRSANRPDGVIGGDHYCNQGTANSLSSSGEKRFAGTSLYYDTNTELKKPKPDHRIQAST